ncbi:MAG: fatty acid cis/trans isomerase, partial [Oceanobacter sp.]
MFSYRKIFSALALLFLSGCAVYATQTFNDLYGDPNPESRRVPHNSYEAQLFRDQVQPILEKRCVSCHSCYDAPCQLKLTSPAGIERGVSQALVYDGTRLLSNQPTRLHIDAHTPAQWRELGFHPVLNERRKTSEANLASSLMFRALALRQQQGDFEQEILNDNEYDLRLYRDQQCPTVETYDNFSFNYPTWGMPYALPQLSEQEFRTLTDWIGRGGRLPDPQPLSLKLMDWQSHWEARLNRDDLKSRLVSRYIYEHIYLYSLYPEWASNSRDTRFKLVRSSTPPGKPVQIIATRRPYNDPGVDRVWYRLIPEQDTVVAKNHIPMHLTEARWKKWSEFLLEPEYRVTELPPYNTELASNPFKTFAQLPADGRYRFLLEHARDTIMAFIKGPVCYGQVAVNVINEQFWVFFVDPDLGYDNKAAEFLIKQARNLDLPAKESSNSLLLASWVEFSEQQRDYLRAKAALIQEENGRGMTIDEQLIWDGDGSNANAALTVMRHFDNATVVQGLLGSTPKTAWVIDYPLLERIHYLLVAGFDVYGNVGHQAATRLYMDFLRMEGESNFLLFLPKDTRQDTRNYWYRDANTSVKDYIFSSLIKAKVDTGIEYQTDNHKQELLGLFRERIGSIISQRNEIETSQLSAAHKAELQKLEDLQGAGLDPLPEVSRVLITRNGQPFEVLSLIMNRGHSNINSLLDEQDALLPEENNLTLALGFVGDYPNVIMRVEEKNLPNWIKRIQTMNNEQDYKALLD